ncbi:MAG: 2-dehydropantoate 2-reductase [Burkholderiales bacterium]|nr:2-dehydropantoate 2-reductase [Burkholderiales bacterium]
MSEPVLIVGAGAIGCWLGGRLAAAGVPVTFVGRPRVIDALVANGLRLTDLDGGDTRLPATALTAATAAPTGSAPALTLLTTKSGATAEAARELAQALPAGSLVLSMQNGISNAQVGAASAPGLVWCAGMVPYNVAQRAPGHYHRGTSGELAAADHPTLRRWRPVFERAGLPIALHADLRPVQWGKLLLNLNNAVNALSGLPLRAQLLDRDLRRCTAALMAETLAVLARAGIQAARVSPLPSHWLPTVMRLPTPLFRLAAARNLRIDAHARSSMADDLAAGRATEVDAINGEVLRLAATAGSAAPLNARIADLLTRWPERQGRPYSGAELRRAIGA